MKNENKEIEALNCQLDIVINQKIDLKLENIKLESKIQVLKIDKTGLINANLKLIKEKAELKRQIDLVANEFDSLVKKLDNIVLLAD